MMFIDFTAILFFTFALEIFLQRSWISVMHSLKIEQVTKLYGPSWHEKTKMGTPTMGGIVFIPVLLLAVPLIIMMDGDFSLSGACGGGRFRRRLAEIQPPLQRRP